MEQNTHRMWWTIGAILLGGILIAGFLLIANNNFTPKISEKMNALIKTTEPEKPPYKYSSYDGKYYITEYTGDSESVTIPSEIDGKKISYISISAFSGKNVTSIKFDKNFDGADIFHDDFFYGMTNLKSISLPSGLTTIPSYTFNTTQLDSVTIPEGVTKIGSSAFSKTKKIKLPTTLTSFMAGDYDYGPGTTFLVPNNITITTSYPNADERDKVVYIGSEYSNYIIDRY